MHSERLYEVDEIKDWLKKKKLTYKALADKLYISEGAVKNWFSKRFIPRDKRMIISKMINEEQPPQTDMMQMTLKFSEEQWKHIAEFKKLCPNEDIEKLAENFLIRIANSLGQQD